MEVLGIKYKYIKYCPHCGSEKIEERCSPTFYCPNCDTEFDIWDLSDLEEV